jgi:hypothetical protein
MPNRNKSGRQARDSAAEYFKAESTMFSGLVVHALSVANSIGRQFTDRRRGYSNWLYVRGCVISRSLERLSTPPPPVYGSDDFLDHAAIAVLARSLIETATVQLYIGDVSISDEEWWCRKHVIDLHDYKNRGNFLDLVGRKRTGPPESSFDFLTEQVVRNRFFQTLSEDRRKKLFSGDDMFVAGRHKAMLQLGWGDRLTRGIYKYLSHQAHAQSMAFHRTEQNKLYEPGSAAAKGTAALATEFARKALGSACLHMISLFPETELALDPVVLSALRSDYTAK